MTRQMTINVNGDVIRVKVRTSTHQGNYNGYVANVNGKTFRIGGLMKIEDAMTTAYAKFVKAHR